MRKEFGESRNHIEEINLFIDSLDIDKRYRSAVLSMIKARETLPQNLSYEQRKDWAQIFNDTLRKHDIGHSSDRRLTIASCVRLYEQSEIGIYNSGYSSARQINIEISLPEERARIRDQVVKRVFENTPQKYHKIIEQALQKRGYILFLSENEIKEWEEELSELIKPWFDDTEQKTIRRFINRIETISKQQTFDET